MWRDTGITTRFFFLDAQCFVMLIPFLVHMSKLTMWISLLSILFFGIIERRGISPIIALRMLRTKINGRIRPAADTQNFRIRSWYC